MNLTWLWVALGLFLIISPAFWLLPSRRQQAQMQLRLAAGRLGLRVTMVRPDWPHWMQEFVAKEVAQYLWPRKNAACKDWQYWQVAPGVWHNQWREPLEEPALLAHLAHLPADVWSISAGPAAVQVTWAERGSEAELAQIGQCLKSL